MHRFLALVMFGTPCLAACSPAAANPHFTGLAQAKDGDSLMVGQ